MIVYHKIAIALIGMEFDIWTNHLALLGLAQYFEHVCLNISSDIHIVIILLHLYYTAIKILSGIMPG